MPCGCARSVRSPRRSSRLVANTGATYEEGPSRHGWRREGRTIRLPNPGGSVTTNPLPFDPIAEAARLWRAHGWEDAADGMAVRTSLMRAPAFVPALVEEVLRAPPV